MSGIKREPSWVPSPAKHPKLLPGQSTQSSIDSALLSSPSLLHSPIPSLLAHSTARHDLISTVGSPTPSLSLTLPSPPQPAFPAAPRIHGNFSLISPPPYPSMSISETKMDDPGTMSPSQYLCSPTAFRPPDILAVGMDQTSFDSGLPFGHAEDMENFSGEKLKKFLKQRKLAYMKELKIRHTEYLTEKFFLLNDGSMVDYITWKKKPNLYRTDYLKAHRLDDDEGTPVTSSISTSLSTGQSSGMVGSTSEIPLMHYGSLTTASSGVTGGNSHLISVTSHRSVIIQPKIPTRMRTFASLDTSHEDIVMRARHEADVMKAVSELRKEGLWSASRLPKVQEPVRRKVHWDYLLEEMQWLATDFINERKWKKGAAKKMVRSVMKHHQDQLVKKDQIEKDEKLKLRKIASTIAKEVRTFWDSINKVAEHKEQLILESKCKKAMDLHLNFIVDQTEKYSSWLVKDYADKSDMQSASVTEDISDMFVPGEVSEDEEETIDQEEAEARKAGEIDYSEEMAALERESQLPIEEILAGLPKEVLEGDQLEPVGSQSNTDPCEADDDEDFQVDESEGDEEETIKEQEKIEKEQNHVEEVDELQEEAGLSIEDLMAKYGYVAMETEDNCESDDSDSDDNMEGDEEDMEEESGSLKVLVSGNTFEETEPGLSDIAAEAELLQPKGTSLESTEVRTKVPFLLRHKLRDYQHIGLDWLVMMNERKLNGILADEMGLGKTIQTIALLAHLACENGNWGPHLIIVPTSVLLNWECEFKKWCPAFKILTYYGSTKERKQLRVGWTKQNAFHVCITSYNLAVKDHRVFKQKKWRYIVLDEAQNIKNFKSQRWQTLLNFSSQHRLLLTGTPLQNSLMELWSLMHFLMPSIFSSHSDFKEWFSNPLTGMVEGSQEYNEGIVKRLHKVLRPFLLRRVKAEVEKQMPKKFEHVLTCRLSKRQRYLYEDYMARGKTKETLATGNFLSVINILMQLRKVCNHPDLFEPRPTVSPFRAAGLVYKTASLVLKALNRSPMEDVDLDFLNLNLLGNEVTLDAFTSYRCQQLQPSVSNLLEVHLDRPAHTEGESTLMEVMDGDAIEQLRLPSMEATLERSRLSIAESVARVNARRCQVQPIYGRDLHKAFDIIGRSAGDTWKLPRGNTWLWNGHKLCVAQLSSALQWDESIEALSEAVKSWRVRSLDCQKLLDKFLMYVPKATCPCLDFHTSHPPVQERLHRLQQEEALKPLLSPLGELLHPVTTAMELQFPETRLIQYDCGKLQRLDMLLQVLKNGGHRALLFTQMARMLDVLEIFLNYHGHTYLRLDGSTPVQKRQMLMERFNRDERIFCFILSTRSGGLGVNLTGADTVIFYDSDWNPTMDAQAQDRCHRIGQTRDVHIYRLVCESTVEENILKKANQKRMLGELAIESGTFTTEFFQKESIRGLFDSRDEPDPPVEAAVEEPPAVEESPLQSPKQIEQILAEVEDQNDVEAASRAKAEQTAELAEFDENFMNQEGKEPTDPEDDKITKEILDIEEQLTGVERFALRVIETQNAEKMAEKLRLAELDIEQAKKNWELGHLKSLREEEERLAEEQDCGNVPLTYDRPETASKVYTDEAMEEMPIWYPPTPPLDDSDMYTDLALDMWYDTTAIMGEEMLPPVDISLDYDVFGLSRQKVGHKKSQLKQSHKKSKDRIPVVSTLFWRKSQAESLAARLKKLAVVPPKKTKSKDQLIPLVESSQQEKIDWSITEDWIILRAITHIHELNIHLTISSPAQYPNFHLIADLVSSQGRALRSKPQCIDRYIGVIHPKEENKHEESEAKRLKQGYTSFKKVKSSKSLKTRGQLVAEGGSEVKEHHSNVVGTIMELAKKMTPPIFPEVPTSPSVLQKNATLLDYGVKYDSLILPAVLSQQKAERIQSEKAAELNKQTQNLMMNQHILTPQHYNLQQSPSSSVASTVKQPFQTQPSNTTSQWSQSQTFKELSQTGRTISPLPSWKLPTTTPQTSQSVTTSIVASGATRPSLPTQLTLMKVPPGQTVDTADPTRTLRKSTTEHSQSTDSQVVLGATSLAAQLNFSSLTPSTKPLSSATVSLVTKGLSTSTGSGVASQLTPQQQFLLMQKLQHQQLIKQKRFPNPTPLQHTPTPSPPKPGLLQTSDIMSNLAKQRNVTEDVIALLKQHKQLRTPTSIGLSAFPLAQQPLIPKPLIQLRHHTSAQEEQQSGIAVSSPSVPSSTVRTTFASSISSLFLGQQSATSDTSTPGSADVTPHPQATPLNILGQQPVKISATSQHGQATMVKIPASSSQTKLPSVTSSASGIHLTASAPQSQKSHVTFQAQPHLTSLSINQILKAQLELAAQQHLAQQSGNSTPVPTTSQPEQTTFSPSEPSTKDK